MYVMLLFGAFKFLFDIKRAGCFPAPNIEYLREFIQSLLFSQSLVQVLRISGIQMNQ